jgi:multicomponent Na+:H+ antiporter subunit A
MTRVRRPRPETTIDLIGPSVQVIFLAVLMASVYLLVAGHNHPGGGFVGGLVASAGIAMRYVTGGIDDVRRLARLKPWTILGSGVLVVIATAAVPMLWGREVLDSLKGDVDLPVFGHVAFSSVLVFDFGVYLVVVGLTLMVLEAFGDDYEQGGAT